MILRRFEMAVGWENDNFQQQPPLYVSRLSKLGTYSLHQAQKTNSRCDALRIWCLVSTECILKVCTCFLNEAKKDNNTPIPRWRVAKIMYYSLDLFLKGIWLNWKHNKNGGKKVNFYTEKKKVVQWVAKLLSINTLIIPTKWDRPMYPNCKRCIVTTYRCHLTYS